MRKIPLLIALFALVPLLYAQTGFTQTDPAAQGETLATDDMDITAASVTYLEDLELLIFEVQVKGVAGNTIPTPRGELNGAPVLGYVFPTTLSSTDVGYNQVEGIVALAITSHPDFDDTPLWDENNDFIYENDGAVFHSHWVVLVQDEQVAGGLSVRALNQDDPALRVPPTHPDMPIYLDSPGFSIVTSGTSLKALVPAQRINYQTHFKFDAVSAYMQVDTSDNGPMLGVYRVYSVLSKNLSLPYRITTQ